jgi:hypothetical protein
VVIIPYNAGNLTFIFMLNQPTLNAFKLFMLPLKFFFTTHSIKNSEKAHNGFS